MTTGEQLRFWALALAAFAGLLWLLSPMLLPFVAGLTIAYFLNPAVDALARHGMPRWGGTLVVLIGFITVVSAIFVLLIPLLQSQVAALIKAIPSYAAKLQRDVLPIVESWINRLSPEDVARLREAAGAHAGQAINWIGLLVQKILSGGGAIVDTLTLVFITPLVAFYLLRDWDKVSATIDRHLPRRHYGTIKHELYHVDQTLAGFVRGQALVCMILGSLYATGLTVAGLEFGAAIGITAGLLSFIPYVGTTFGWVTSLLLGFMQFDNFTPLGIIIGVFVVGQILEGYFLTPKLVGDRVGLHPVWILFALLAGGSLLGFVGVLIAVPVAAVIGVLIRFLLRQYRDSRYYKPA